jgi:hypothetical protein
MAGLLLGYNHQISHKHKTSPPTFNETILEISIVRLKRKDRSAAREKKKYQIQLIEYQCFLNEK